MPWGDGTGPMGLGPMTGRAAGYCAGYPVPGYMNPAVGYGRPGLPGLYGGVPYGAPYGYAPGPYGVAPGWFGGFRRGFGRGWGRGMGWGRGFGRGRWRGRAFAPYAYPW